jgi:polar amino acid transport system substrate-binding protein
MRKPSPAVIADLAPGEVLRAAVNLGNPVLAQGTPAEPAGVTVDIAREVASRIGVQLAFVCVTAARHSFEAMMTGQADVCFLAIEPEREAQVAFTAPYVLTEGVFAVPDQSGLASVGDVDRHGVRIGVRRGSAYDLYLSSTLRHATVLATARPATKRFLYELVEELKASGFVADSLHRSGQSATVAPAGKWPGQGRPSAQPAVRARIAATSAGITSLRSPMTAYSARDMIGASGSVLTTTMCFADRQPAMCWIAPLMPHAR